MSDPHPVLMAVREVMDDMRGDSTDALRKGRFLDPAMSYITTMLEGTSEMVTPLVMVTALLLGKTEEEACEMVRTTCLQGAFALGCIVGMELQKRGYVPSPDTSLDQPSV